MGAVVPFIPQIISGGSAVLGSLLGKKKSKSAQAAQQPYTPDPAYTKPLADLGGSLLPMAQKGFQSAFDYHSGVMADPAAATASDAASIGRQTQQLTQRAARTMPRGGAQASIVGGLPQQQMAAGLERRIGAQQNAAQNLGSLAGSAGGLGTNVFGGLLGNQLGGYQQNIQGGYLDLANRREDRGYYGDIGGSIYDILTGKSGGGQGPSILDKLGGLLGGGKGGVSVPKAPGSFNVPITGLPNYGDWSKILGLGR